VLRVRAAAGSEGESVAMRRIADIAAAMRDENVSLEAMIQRARGDTVPVVLTTHETTEAAIHRVVRRLGNIDSILEPPHVLPIEQLA
jgi:homoserine dehydrogenase